MVVWLEHIVFGPMECVEIAFLLLFSIVHRPSRSQLPLWVLFLVVVVVVPKEPKYRRERGKRLSTRLSSPPKTTTKEWNTKE